MELESEQTKNGVLDKSLNLSHSITLTSQNVQFDRFF